jgi:hypothetical protein
MKLLLSSLLVLLLLSCTNNTAHEPETETTVLPPSASDSATVGPELTDRMQYFVWDVNSDAKTIRQNPKLRPQYYSVDTLLMGLNERYPRILLEKKRIGHDTLYTEIKDAMYLTDQMGSSGAEEYLAQAVINLTSVNGIRYVRIDFTEGSHASPDVWGREAFSDYKEVK